MPRESSLRTEGQICGLLNRVMKEKGKESRKETAVLIREIQKVNEETEGHTITSLPAKTASGEIKSQAKIFPGV